MPTLEHNGLVELFRENPSLAPHLLESLFHIDVPRYASAGVVESALDQLVPIEFRADLVLALRGEADKLVLSIILEVQRDQDDDKKFAWPVYATVERSRKRCPAIVLVVTTDAAVAAWASERIDVGLGLASVQPLVLGPAVVPEVTDQAVADREPELAILSAVVHGNGPNGLAILKAAITALEQRMDHVHAAAYFQIVYNALREPLREAVEKLIMIREPVMDERARALFEHIFVRPRAQGRAEGKLEGKRDALLRLMAHTGLALTDDQRARIEACDDVATLDRWFEQVFGAKTAAEALA